MEAPEFIVEQWINSEPLSLKDLKGKVVAVHFFQMLCPGCVVHGLPQTQRFFQALSEEEYIQIIAMHSVFEHREVMTVSALKAFAEEFRYTFPIAVDSPVSHGSIPQTMQAYQVRGTPSWVIIDHKGEVVANLFGRVSDMGLGLRLGELIQKARKKAKETTNVSIKS